MAGWAAGAGLGATISFVMPYIGMFCVLVPVAGASIFVIYRWLDRSFIAGRPWAVMTLIMYLSSPVWFLPARDMLRNWQQNQEQSHISAVIEAIKADDLARYKDSLWECGDVCSKNSGWDWMSHVIDHKAINIVSYETPLMSPNKREELLADYVRLTDDESALVWIAEHVHIQPNEDTLWRAIQRCHVELLSFWLTHGVSLPEQWTFSQPERSDISVKDPLSDSIHANCSDENDINNRQRHISLVRLIIAHGFKKEKLAPNDREQLEILLR
jgi:hypothetical protein